MAGNTNFDSNLTATLHNYVSTKLEDNVFKKNKTLKSIRAKTGKRTKGGDKLVMPLMYGENTTVKTMTPYGIFDTTPQEGITAAEYLWANLGGTVVLDNFTIDVMNAGEAKVIDLLDEKIKQLEMSMTKLLNTQLWASGRSSAYQLWSLYDICNAGFAGGQGGTNIVDPTYTGDGTGYGRISIASDGNLWWRPMAYYQTGDDSPTETAATADTTWDMPNASTVISASNINHLVNMCSDGDDGPNLIVMPMNLYEKFESLLIATYRSGPDSALADSGIEHITHKGIPVIFDRSCTAGTVYALNTDYLQFITCTGRDMQSTPFQVPHNQDVRVSKIIWSGQLGCSNRSKQGCWAGVTTA